MIFKIFAAAMTISSLAWGHARLNSNAYVVPRNTSAGLKSGPCGGVARTGSSIAWKSGQTVTISWEEVIQHPGRYEFYISEANDQNFKLIKTVPDTQDDKATLPHLYSTSFVVPEMNCSACTFQMIQVMTEDPANPSNYYSCADIQIASSSATPAPAPNENCN